MVLEKKLINFDQTQSNMRSMRENEQPEGIKGASQTMGDFQKTTNQNYNTNAMCVI